MENLRQILIAMISTATLAAILFWIDEIVATRAARRAAEKTARARDMAARAERIKRERMAAAREQMWLEYTREEDAPCRSHKDA